ncbi:hypothetical protein BHE74_00052327 [Ensete ventricosum]|nr:hypothetical protein BHE74_00052327 [Ensete ventricosum]
MADLAQFGQPGAGPYQNLRSHHLGRQEVSGVVWTLSVKTAGREVAEHDCTTELAEGAARINDLGTTFLRPIGINTSTRAKSGGLFLTLKFSNSSNTLAFSLYILRANFAIEGATSGIHHLDQSLLAILVRRLERRSNGLLDLRLRDQALL